MLLSNVGSTYEFLDEECLNILNRNGIKRVSDFLSVDPEKIISLCNCLSSGKTLDLQSILSFRKYLFTHYAAFAAGGWYSNVRKSTILATGVECMDNILCGGLKSGFIYEIYGFPGSGRTQFALFITANNAADKGNTLYIDTKNDFCIDRFCEIMSSKLKPNNSVAKRMKLNCDEHEEIMEGYVKNVRMAKVYDMESLLDAVSEIANSMDNLSGENDMLPEDWKFYKNIRLLVIDNIASIVLPLLGNEQYTMGDITALTSQFIEKIR